jgi:hypothetical protein
MAFTKASKKRARLRLALIGPGGSGKTYTALRLATSLAQGGTIAGIDTERGSMSKYANEFKFDVDDQMATFAPAEYTRRIHEAEKAGYAVIIIDSLSHAWSGIGGALEMVDSAVARTRAHNSFAAWREVTPAHNALVDAMLSSPCHIIVTMRVKTEYVLEENEKGKKVPRRIGLAPIQRDGLEYEFDVMCDMDLDNTLIVGKTRCSAIHGAIVRKPGDEFANKLVAWLTDGEEAPPPPAPDPVVTADPEGLATQIMEAFAAAGFPADVGEKLLTQALVGKRLAEPTAAFAEAMIAAINAGKYDAKKPKPATADITQDDLAALGGGQ